MPRPRIAIISDTQAPLVHPATGQIFDSKSQFRAATRAAGCVELGNDAASVTPAWQTDRKVLRDDINQAISELEQGRPAPLPVPEGGMTRRYE